MGATETILRADAALTPTGPLGPAEVAFDESGVLTYVGGVRAGGPCSRELNGRVLMPGLVNGHTHSAMTLQRGVSDDAGFADWLSAVQSIEQHLTHADIEAGLDLAMLEMIETGTTAFADMYFWDAELIERVIRAGMRALVAPATFTAEAVGFPGVSPLNGAEVTRLTEQLAERYAQHPQVRIAFGPHAPYTSPPEFLADIAQRARRLGIPVHTHVSETRAEFDDMRARTGVTPIEHLEKLALFDAAVLAAHCVHVSEDDIGRLAGHRVAVSHNPVSNLKLGAGIAPVPDLRRAGVRLALGTDGAASNNTLDLFEEIKTAAILHRGVQEDGGAMQATDVLDIATQCGAEAIGFPESGALQVGKQADIIALEVSGASSAQFAPSALVSHLGFVATGADVRDVWIGGREVYANGIHRTLDAEAIIERGRAATRRLRTAAGRSLG